MFWNEGMEETRLFYNYNMGKMGVDQIVPYCRDGLISKMNRVLRTVDTLP